MSCEVIKPGELFTSDAQERLHAIMSENKNKGLGIGQNILNAIKDSYPRSLRITDISSLTQLSSTKVKNNVYHLVQKGLVNRVGPAEYVWNPDSGVPTSGIKYKIMEVLFKNKASMSVSDMSGAIKVSYRAIKTILNADKINVLSMFEEDKIRGRYSLSKLGAEHMEKVMEKANLEEEAVGPSTVEPPVTKTDKTNKMYFESVIAMPNGSFIIESEDGTYYMAEKVQIAALTEDGKMLPLDAKLVKGN